MKELNKNLIESFINSDETFCIDFEMAWQWVGYFKKQKAKTSLKNNFIENIDYVVFTQVDQKTIGRPLQHFKLTIECFKSFCMMAKTEKGREVRKYFIDCEKRLKESFQQPKIEAPKTQAEILLMNAQLLVDQEKRLTNVETEILELKNNRDYNLKQLNSIEKSNTIPFDIPLRKKIKEYINTYARAVGVSYPVAWGIVDKQFKLRYSIDIKQRKKTQQKERFDILQELNLLNEYYAVACHVLKIKEA